MPPKKGKGKTKGKKKALVEEIPLKVLCKKPWPVLDLPNKHTPLLDAIKDDFFKSGDLLLQHLAEEDYQDEAAQVKQIFSIVKRLHTAYVEEYKETSRLRPMINEANFKFNLALELTGQSQEAMNELKKAISEAWKEADASKDREAITQEKLQEIMLRCKDLQSKVEPEDEGNELGNLQKYKNIILRERDRLSGEVIDLEKRLQFQRYYGEETEKVIKLCEENAEKSRGKLKQLEQDRNLLEKKVFALNSSNEDMKEFSSGLLKKNNELQSNLTELQSTLVSKAKEVERLRVSLDKSKNEFVRVNRHKLSLETEIEMAKKDKKVFDEAFRALKHEHKEVSDNYHTTLLKYKQSKQDYGILQQKMIKSDKIISHQKEDILKLNSRANNLEKDIISSTSKYEELRLSKENVTRERDRLRSDSAKLNNTLAEMRHKMMMMGISIDNLKLDVEKRDKMVEDSKKLVELAEKERDEQAQIVEVLQDKIEALNEDLQIKSDQISDLNEKLTIKHNNFMKIQKRLEATNSERVMLQRSLETTTQEREDLKILQSKGVHQMALMSQEVANNVNLINGLNLKIERCSSEKKELQTEMKNLRTILQNVRDDLKNMKSKNEKLSKTISDDELRFLNLVHELEDIKKEKNLIGLQMVRRNDEINLLKEKLSIVQTALDKGSVQYNQRIEDIKLLKVQIANMTTERNVLLAGMKSTAKMREEIIRLHRTLNQVQIQNKTLMEDVQIPANLHRWRVLKGSEPSRYELVKKLNITQRRLIRNQVHTAKIQQELKESRKEIGDLKGHLKKIPNMKFKDALYTSQAIIRKRDRTIKAIAAELYVNQVELKSKDYTIGQANMQLVKCKKYIKRVKPLKICDVDIDPENIKPIECTKIDNEWTLSAVKCDVSKIM